MRVLFAGTPEVALPALTALMDSPEHEVVGVLTRADARRGRGTSQAGRRPDQGAILPEILQCVTPGDYSLCRHSMRRPAKRYEQRFYGTPEKQRPQNQRKSRHS